MLLPVVNRDYVESLTAAVVRDASFLNTYGNAVAMDRSLDTLACDTCAHTYAIKAILHIESSIDSVTG